MDRIQRHELAKKGKTILRGQYNQRKTCWNIYQYTLSGGWKKFGTQWFSNASHADRRIDEIVSFDPDKYVKDN